MLHGVDVHARYQKGLVASSLPKVDFVITKATGGTDLVVDNWLSMLKGAALTGVYHYARETYCQGTAAQEAAHFISQAKLAPKDAMIVLDWEEKTGTNLGNTTWVLEWCQTVEKALGRRPVIYTGNSVLKEFPGWWDWSNKHDYWLWYARYPYSNAVGWKDYSLPTVPNWPDAKIAMWQYSSSGGIPGYPGALDLNIFYGDKNHWRKVVGETDGKMVWDGKMASPVVGRVSAEHRFNPTGGYAGHAGIDIACKVNTPVFAAYGGVVEAVGANLVANRSGNRNVLIRNPDGERQYYGHCEEALVKIGQTVAQGEQIALSGARGNVTGPHLHFECWSSIWDDDRNPRVDFTAHGVVPGSDTGQDYKIDTGDNTAEVPVESIEIPDLGGIVDTMVATHIIFQHKNAICVANILAGTWAKAPDTDTFKNRCTVLGRAGAKLVEWKNWTSSKSNEVDNPGAFGTQIPWASALS